MARESASYHLTIAREIEDAVLVALREGGAEPAGSEHAWIELRLRNHHAATARNSPRSRGRGSPIRAPAPGRGR